MTAQEINLDTWPRAETYRYFRAYERPHYAITSRVDVSALMALREVQILSVFRSCLWAIGAGLAASPALNQRFQGDKVFQYNDFLLSSPIDAPDGTFRYSYIPWHEDRQTFDQKAATIITETRSKSTLDPIADRHNVAFLSCLPWLDYTSLDNALPDADDCIPRVSWGKIVPTPEGHNMAVTLQVHHALVDGRDAGRFFEATQSAFDAL